MSIIIEKAKVNEFEGINRVMEEGQREHAEALPHIFKDTSPVMPRVFFEELLNDEKLDLLVAKQDDQIVGFALLRINQSPSFQSVHQRTYTYIDDFGVAKGMQGQGIGRKLFEACRDWALERGSQQLELTVWEFNNKALEFYEALGMETINRKMSITLKNNN
jgi:diamine N-acetyltransferase